MNNTKTQFAKELQVLLEKYDVSIGFGVGECSDTYGLYGEHMLIEPTHRQEQGWQIKITGWVISADDLKELGQ